MTKNLIVTFLLLLLAMFGVTSASAKEYTLRSDKLQITIGESGELLSLKNLKTGQDYAGRGYLWRLYFDDLKAKEQQVQAAEQTPRIAEQDGKITLTYDRLHIAGRTVRMQVVLTVSIDGDMIRFSSSLRNDEPHTIIRELHYPLVSNMNIPDDFDMLITDAGGRRYSNPRQTILKNSNLSPYKTPAQLFRQMDVKYPTRVAANCFAFFDGAEGIYFGSHDPLFQDTWHGLRLYPDVDGDFNRLEAGFFKYPNCFSGETWACEANVVAPYTGSWHETSRMYRRWADTWWEHIDQPQWVKMMRSWQRVIFKHQYGEYLFKYTDLAGRIKRVGESVGADAVFTFGWWETGMDNGNPHYNADPTQGGDKGWKKAIADYKKDGGKILLYFNGKLIDRESEFYKSGKGKEICYRDNTGAEFTEQYKFTGVGTFLGEYNTRTFAIADTRSPIWRKMLLEWADRAYDYGANSVFYDQLGYAEHSTNWDRSREFAVPNLRVAANKAEILKIIRDHNRAKDAEFALGTEWLTDVTAQYCDYIHMYSTTWASYSFIDWFRYTFPEVIVSDREVRDDTDIERRVNNTILKGLRNDIEIYRCRDLIDKCPNYQSYLAKINDLKLRYAKYLLLGRYTDTDNFTITNSKVEARSFTADGGMAIVATQPYPDGGTQSARIAAEGYTFKESRTLGDAMVSADGSSVALGKYALAVLIFEKK